MLTLNITYNSSMLWLTTRVIVIRALRPISTLRLSTTTLATSKIHATLATSIFHSTLATHVRKLIPARMSVMSLSKAETISSIYKLKNLKKSLLGRQMISPSGFLPEGEKPSLWWISLQEHPTPKIWLDSLRAFEEIIQIVTLKYWHFQATPSLTLLKQPLLT